MFCVTCRHTRSPFLRALQCMRSNNGPFEQHRSLLRCRLGRDSCQTYARHRWHLSKDQLSRPGKTFGSFSGSGQLREASRGDLYTIRLSRPGKTLGSFSGLGQLKKGCFCAFAQKSPPQICQNRCEMSSECMGNSSEKPKMPWSSQNRAAHGVLAVDSS